MEDQNFPAFLRRQMARREYNLTEFARAIGFAPSVVSRWMNGTRPDPVSVERVADALGADYDWLLALAGHRPRTYQDDPLVTALLAKLRAARLTPDRYHLLEVLLDEMRDPPARTGG